MKSTVSEKPCEAEIEYPCLMKSPHGRIILFYLEDAGVQVNDEAGQLGRHNTHWKSITGTSVPYHGSVCLEN